MGGGERESRRGGDTIRLRGLAAGSYAVAWSAQAEWALAAQARQH